MTISNFNISVSVPTADLEDFATFNGWVEFINDEFVESAEDFVKHYAKEVMKKELVKFTEYRVKQKLAVEHMKANQIENAIVESAKIDIDQMINVQ